MWPTVCLLTRAVNCAACVRLRGSACLVCLTVWCHNPGGKQSVYRQLKQLLISMGRKYFFSMTKHLTDCQHNVICSFLIWRQLAILQLLLDTGAAALHRLIPSYKTKLMLSWGRSLTQMWPYEHLETRGSIIQLFWRCIPFSFVIHVRYMFIGLCIL